MRKILFISLFANVVGAVLLIKGFIVPTRVVEASRSDLQPSAARAKHGKASKVQNSQAVEEFKPPFDWHSIESADYAAYISNLRSVNCPETTIADIIIAEVNKVYRDKLAPLREQREKKYEFWRNDWGWNESNSEYSKAVVAAEKEKSKLLAQLLGHNFREQMAQAFGYPMAENDPFWSGLSADKKDRAGEIREKYSEMRNDFYRKTRGYQDADDQKELQKIEISEVKELAKVLTPDEIFEFQLRNSHEIQNMRWNELSGFKASEEEFRAIAKVKLVDEMAELSGEKLSSADKAKLVNEANEALKKVMGEERYKEYQENQDYEFRNLKKIIEKNGGTKEIASQIYHLKEDLAEAIKQLRQNHSLSKDERLKKMAAIKAETERTLVEAVGERAAKSIRSGWAFQNAFRELSN